MNELETLAALKPQVQALQDSAVALVIEETQPEIIDVSEQADQARKILSKPLQISMPGGQPDTLGPWTFAPEDLAGMLSFEYVQGNDGLTSYQASIDTLQLREFLGTIAPDMHLNSENTRFIFNDQARLLEVLTPAIIGRDLDIEGSIKIIQQKLLEGEHQVELALTNTTPPVTDSMTGQELGITELVHDEISYFYGSSAARIQNIEAAANEFQGLLVAPGETFSMAEHMGDISVDNGYAEALIILGGQTIQGIGGGICQVSTTLFRAAFFSGFPIVERHSHAYRVSYYEKVAGNRIDPNLAGLDATVFVPLVDFKFTNDTPYWLSMEVYVNPSYDTIEWKFYSTSDGRTIEWDTSGPSDIVEAPKPLYRENPELPQGEVKQVDWTADGADITVHRKVYRAGNLLLDDTFFTHYQPWQAVFEYGPGTEGMPPPDAETPTETPSPTPSP